MKLVKLIGYRSMALYVVKMISRKYWGCRIQHITQRKTEKMHSQTKRKKLLEIFFRNV